MTQSPGFVLGVLFLALSGAGAIFWMGMREAKRHPHHDLGEGGCLVLFLAVVGLVMLGLEWSFFSHLTWTP
jgi:hypothetical protein